MEWLFLKVVMFISLSIPVAWAVFRKIKTSRAIFVKALPAFLAAVGLFQNLPAHQGEDKGRGLISPSQQVKEHVENNWQRIIGVKPNKIGLERMQQHLKNNNMAASALTPASREEEFITVVGKNVHQTGFEASESSATLPTSVDNSQLPSFPPIGDQQQLGSCVAWGTTYYQATHEYGLLNGLNNKTSNQNVFSPKWTYNNCNDGVDGGLDIFSTYQLFSQNGHAKMVNFPYDTDYTSWDLNPTDWVKAPNYRFGPGQLVDGLGGSGAQNLTVIKQLLNNGHVLTMGTYIDSWVTGYVGSDPGAASNPHAGEQAAIYMNGTNGGHCMTIVGYDDNVWIDVNHNGQVDPGEKGAFKVANSWNSDWGNQGFIWVAYDAFLSQSAVHNGPSAGRVPLADAMNSQLAMAVPLAHNVKGFCFLCWPYFPINVYN